MDARTRYVATCRQIAARDVEHSIICPAGFRNVDAEARYFTPHREPLSDLGHVIAFARSLRRVAIAGIAS